MKAVIHQLTLEQSERLLNVAKPEWSGVVCFRWLGRGEEGGAAFQVRFQARISGPRRV